MQSPYQMLLNQARDRRQLVSVHWELTHRCTARCSHCYLDVLRPGARPVGELSTHECLHLLDQLEAMGVLNLTFSGGEILCRSDFLQIAEYAHRRRFLMRFFTNGLHVTKAVAEQMAALHPYAVEISIYGVDSLTHDAITGIPGSFDRTRAAFTLLRGQGVRTVMKTPLMHENVRQLYQLRELASAMGATLRVDQTITPRLSGDHAPLRHQMDNEDLLWLTRATLDVALWPAHPAAAVGRCAIGQSALVVDPYGNVFPCVEVRLSAGNVRVQPLQTIWDGSPLWAQMLELAGSVLPACKSCTLSAFCVRCHGMALAETGDLRGRALANCRAASVRRRVLAEKAV